MTRVLTLWMLCVCTPMLPALAAPVKGSEPRNASTFREVSIQGDATRLVQPESPAGRIVGIVTTRDAVSKPVDFANILLMDAAMGTMSRNGGRFSFDGVPAGTYSLTATFVATDPQVIAKVRVEPNATTVVKFCLQIPAGLITVMSVETRCGCRRIAESVASSWARKEIPQAMKWEPATDVVALGAELHVDCGGRRSITPVERPVPAVRPVRPPTPLAPPLRITAIAVTASLSVEVEEELITCECGTSRAPSFVIAGVEKNSEPMGEEAALPKVTRLRGCTPNPFNPMTTIRFELAEKQHVELQIYDARGRRVRWLLSREMGAGPQAVVWDGKTDAGQLVPSAVYFLRMEAGSFHTRSKLIALR